MMKDLVLTSNKERGPEVKIILPNIPSQRYVFGSSYPGSREGEVFIPCSNLVANPIGRTHCVISVDEQGQYWIEDCTSVVRRGKSAFKTFLNWSRVKAWEHRRLECGDIVFLGGPDTPSTNFFPPCHIFHVTERIISTRDLKCDENLMNELLDDPNSPLANDLILEKIMGYLPVKDLKNARLVSKKWGKEASKALKKRGRISMYFTSDGYYEAPECSTRVLRYLHEMRGLKMQNLAINLTHPFYWQKMLDDLRKLLKSSHNFSNLFLTTEFSEEYLLLFSTVFQELGEKLEELNLDGHLAFESLPEVPPPLPLMPNLKKFAHLGYTYGDDDEKLTWASLLVPLFANNLEHFTCNNDMADPYLQAFLTQDMPKLRGLSIERREINKNTLPLLLSLKNALTSLRLIFYPKSEEEVRLLEKLLSKHSPSLQVLAIWIDNNGFLPNKNLDVRLPAFPKLEVLKLSYDGRTRISWERGLDYKKHFPSLRKIKVTPPPDWSKDDPVFHAFFTEGELRCETVKEVWIPFISRYRSPLPEADSLRSRMDQQIREMFPAAEKINFFH